MLERSRACLAMVSTNAVKQVGRLAKGKRLIHIAFADGDVRSAVDLLVGVERSREGTLLAQTPSRVGKTVHG
jgi:hypothetical protein